MTRIRSAALALALLAGTPSLVGLASPTQASASASAPAARKASAVTGLRLVKPTTSGDRATFTAKWRRTPGARGYRIRWSTSPTMSPASGAGPRGTSYVLRNLGQGVPACVQVRAKLRSGKGPWSPVVCRTTPRLDQVAPPWVDAQRLEGTPPTGVTVTLTWPRTAGARSYQVDWAPGTGDVQRSSAKRTVTAAVSGTPDEHRAIGGLKAGQPYCFQVRAVGKWGVGPRSTTACKITLPANRPPRPTASALTMATWNLCSSMCSGWKTRGPLAQARIAGLNADVVSVQEAMSATPGLTTGLASSGYVRGCQVGDGVPGLGSGPAGRQALFVRSATYRVVDGTAGGIVFSQVKSVYPSHGACWVRVENVATGQQVVVASVHLVQPIGAAYDRGREKQTNELMAAIARQYPTGAPPIVLAGDFNSHRGRADDAPRRVLEAKGYHDGYDAAESFLSPTYRKSAHGWSTTPATDYRWGRHMDRVFAPAGAEVASWRIEEPMTPEGDRYAGLLSDHSPVIVSLRIPLGPVTPR